MPGLEISVVFEAAGEGIEIGGDLYDVLPTDDGCWVLIGDVAGKGSAAAGVSVAVRHAVRGLTREIDEPEEVLRRVNELLLEGTGLNDFATALLMRMRPRERRLDAVRLAARRPPAGGPHARRRRRPARRRRRARRLGRRRRWSATKTSSAPARRWSSAPTAGSRPGRGRSTATPRRLAEMAALARRSSSAS